MAAPSPPLSTGNSRVNDSVGERENLSSHRLTRGVPDSGRFRGGGLVWSVVLGMLAGVSAAPAQQVRRESVIAPMAEAANERLARVLELAASSEWERAAAVLRQMERLDADALVEVEPRRHVSVTLVVPLLRAQFPQSALVEDRAREEEQARARLVEAQRLDDPLKLEEVWRAFPSTRAAAEAVALQADLFEKQGQPDVAAARWRLLEPPAEETPIDPAAMLRIRTTHIPPADRTAGSDEPDGAPAPRIGPPVWRVPAHEASESGRRSSPLELASRSPSTIVPLVQEGRVYLAENSSLRAVNVQDGRPVWPVDDGGRGDAVYGDPLEAEYAYQLPYTGELERWVAVAEGRLLAVVGAPFSVAAPLEPRMVESRLLSLDVATQEGKLQWRRTPREVLPDPAWRFSGPPLALGDRVWLSARRATPSMAIGVVCLNAADGTPLWFRQVAGLLHDPVRTSHLVTTDRLTVDTGRVYLAGDFGAVACLEGAKGRIDWLRRDDPPGPAVSPESQASELPGRSALLHHGRLYSVGRDDVTVQSLDTVTGAREWGQAVETPLRQLVGVRAGRVVAAGEELWGLDVETGAVRWRVLGDDAGTPFLGQAVLDGNRLYACTAGELFVIDVATGAMVQRVPLWEEHGVRGGRLVLAEDRLLVASSEELVALEFQR